MSRLPTLFLSHGAPPSLDDAGWLAALGRWAGTLPRPKAILSLSAHWEARPATLGARTTLKHSPKRGRIIIEYQGNEDLSRVLEKMGVTL